MQPPSRLLPPLVTRRGAHHLQWPTGGHPVAEKRWRSCLPGTLVQLQPPEMKLTGRMRPAQKQ